MRTYKVNCNNGIGQRIVLAYDLKTLAITLGLGKVKITSNKLDATITTFGQREGYNTSYIVTEMSNEDEEALTYLQNEREAYVCMFIGDFDKPYNYNSVLATLDAKIAQLQCKK